jgi:hypothetical protein
VASTSASQPATQVNSRTASPQKNAEVVVAYLKEKKGVQLNDIEIAGIVALLRQDVEGKPVVVRSIGQPANDT